MKTVAEATKPLRARDISERLDLQITATHRALNTLVDAGYLSRHESGSYVAGQKLGLLRHAFLSSYFVRDVALPHMQLLSFITGESVLLHVPLGWYALLISSASVTKDAIDARPLGRVAALDQIAGGIILLRSFDAEKLKAFETYRGGAQREAFARELKRRFRKIDPRGHLFEVGEGRPSYPSVAFPVRCNGAVIAALTIEGPAIDRGPDWDDLLARCWGAVSQFEKQISQHPELYADPFGHLAPQTINWDAAFSEE